MWVGLLALLVTMQALAALSVSQVVAATGAGVEAGTKARVDINTADEKTLQKIPGVGEALAKRIVEFREQHGPFDRVEDLMKVRGIGEKSLEKMRAHVTVGKRK